MRREGKLYSFEDQKWDVEMRLEMEKKKKRELLEGAGGGEKVEKNVRALMKEAKLSQKQKVKWKLVSSVMKEIKVMGLKFIHFSFGRVDRFRF